MGMLKTEAKTPPDYSKMSDIEIVSHVLALVDQAVADRGEDYVYRAPNNQSACYYAHGERHGLDHLEVGCLIGYILWLDGVSLGDLYVCTGSSLAVVTRLRPAWSRALGLALRQAQSIQDSKRSWGEARASLRGHVEGVYGSRAVGF